jgi:cytoskeletal protein CcmA (bactofilin family)
MRLFSSNEDHTRPPEGRRPVSVLGAGIEVTGSIRATGTIRVDGVVRGDVLGGEEIVVGCSGEIHGDVAADQVMVGGRLHGHLVAASSVRLTASAVVDGDVRTPRLTIEEGAVVNGHLAMGSAAPDAVELPATAPALGLVVA